jgi:hypothetical protein
MTRNYVFGWSLPAGCTNRDLEQAYGPETGLITVLNRTMHTARIRQHICSECMAPIHIGQRYSCTVYKDDESGKISQYKTHIVCPYEELWP